MLDVGPGYGKYGLLIREYLSEKPRRLEALEVDEWYVQHFTWLSCIYDEVFVGDARSFDAYMAYDMVLLLDVIEHIPKEEALPLLRRIPGRVVISTPCEWFEQSVPGHPHEDHVSHWNEADFEATGRVEHMLILHGGIVCRLGPR